MPFNVAIIGRPNVGKSTLFNRLIGYSKAIVMDQPGVTRDRNEAAVQVDPKIHHTKDTENLVKNFTLVDTGGIQDASFGNLEEQVVFQSRTAISEADIVLALFDGHEGVLPADKFIMDLLRKSKKPFLVVVNKIDNDKRGLLTAEFYRLGIEKLYLISAAHGIGINDLMTELVLQLNALNADVTGESLAANPSILRIAICGRPNVGKSSLINALLNNDRLLVSDIPGTTRDAIDIHFTMGGRDICLIDTAGLRRKSKIDQRLEKHSVTQSIGSIDRADVVAIVLDATEFMTDQDLRIANYAVDQRRGIYFVVNKWDLVAKSGISEKDYQNTLYRFAKTLDFSPLVFTSAVANTGISDIIETALKIDEARKHRVSTAVFNQFIQATMSQTPPPALGHQLLSIKYATQSNANPPIFTLFAKNGVTLPQSYKRFLTSQIRKQFGFVGVPLTLKMNEA
jgi:GTP-binding protein